VILGGQTLGRDYLKNDGEDNQCNKMSKILDLAAVPMDTVSSAGELIVRIEASLGVNSNECDGSYLRARVKLTTCTGRILLCERSHAYGQQPMIEVTRELVCAGDKSRAREKTDRAMRLCGNLAKCT
jgi:hypothetical protein